MQVVVKKTALLNLLKKTLNEDGKARSDMFLQPQNMVDFEEDDSPIEAAPHMSLQLSEEEPPVDDPEFVPGSLRELGLSAMRMMREVPGNQIEFVYRFLHRLLDMALDREEDEQGAGTSELLEGLTPEQMKVIQAALPRMMKGEPIDALSRELASQLTAEESEVEEALGDVMMSGLDPSGPTQEPPQKQDQPRSTIRRRPRKQAPPEPELPSVPPETVIEDVESLPEYQSATNKDDFLSGYNAGADTAALDNSKEDTSQESPDYQAGYKLGYQEFYSEEPAEPIDDSDDTIEDLDDDSLDALELKIKSLERESSVQLVDLTDLDDIESILKVSEEIKKGLTMFAYKIEGYHSIVFNTRVFASDAGRPVSRSEEETIAKQPHIKYQINNEETFFLRNFKKHSAKFSDEQKVIELANHQIDVFYNHGEEFIGSYDPSSRAAKAGVRQDMLTYAKNFKNNIDNLQKKLGENIKTTIYLLASVFAEDHTKIEMPNIGLLPNEEAALEKRLKSIFAFTVRYPENKKEKKSRPYQSNNSGNFRDYTYKPEHEEEIIKDFIANIENKITVDRSSGEYKIPSGKRGLTYRSSVPNVEEAARDFAMGKFLEAQEAQAEIAKVKAKKQKEIEDAKNKPKDRKKREVIDAFYRDNFKEAGYTSGGGFKQDLVKFGERFYKIFVKKSLEEDPTREAAKVQLHSFEAVLNILSDKLGELYIDEMDELEIQAADPDFSETTEVVDRMKFLTVAQAMHVNINDASAQNDKARKARQPIDRITKVSVKNDDGSTQEFGKSLGGALTRSINQMITRKFLVRFDQDIHAPIVQKILGDEKFQEKMRVNLENLDKWSSEDSTGVMREIERKPYLSGKPLDVGNEGVSKQESKEKGIPREPSHVKIAKSLAEYWTGKKAVPDLEIYKKYDEEYDEEYVTKRFAKSGGDGWYKKKGGAAELLAHGIDGEMYIDIARIVAKFINDAALEKFKYDEEGEDNYRDLYEAEHLKLDTNDKHFEKVVSKAISEIIEEFR